MGHSAAGRTWHRIFLSARIYGIVTGGAAPFMAGGPISYTGNERKLGFSDDTIKAAEQYVAIITLCIGGMDSLLLWELVDGGGHSNFCFELCCSRRAGIRGNYAPIS